MGGCSRLLDLREKELGAQSSEERGPGRPEHSGKSPLRKPESPALGQGGQLGAADSPPQVPAVVALWPLPTASG